MKTYSIRELRDHLSEAVEESQRSAIVLLKHGKPIAVIRGVEGYTLDDLITANDRELWEQVRKARRQISKGKFRTSKELRAELGLTPKRKPR